jgi:DNA repair exonuclease SbcCD ATPase subunit
MTEIKIQRLILENFKCHKALTLNFNGGNASIYGDNASGKTSIYDALTWLLFSKDSQGNGEKNIEIKPLNAKGEVKDHDALTAVEAVLLVNGDEITLRKTYREVWSTKRGSSEATFDGNTSEYSVNGVPCKKNAFQAKVGELVSEDTFRLLTSVSHFAAGIPWQERRAVLFRISGALDDKAIMATNAQFQPLLDSLGRLTIEDYKKKLVSEKKGFTVSKTELPARISECQKTIEDIEGINFAAIRAEADALRIHAEDLGSQIRAAETSDGIRNKELELREARLEASTLEQENNNHKAAQMASRPNLTQMRGTLAYLDGQVKSRQAAIDREKSMLLGLDRLIQAARDKWIATNNDTFRAEKCPTCGQTMPADKIAQASAQFEENKQKRLREVEEAAASHKASKAAAEDRIARAEQEAQELLQQVTDKKAEIAQAEQGQTPVTDMPDYQTRRAAIDAKIQKLNVELMDLRTSAASVVGSIRAEKEAAERKLFDLQATLSKESLLEYSRKRIEELRADAQNASAALEAIEKMLFLIEDFTRYKTSFVEESINGMFRIARFRLFREQANGGIEERCDVVHEGVPYLSVNNGMKINLGVDIINTLSMAYGVRVPLFVDNAESVTKLEHCNSQIIRLVVSENDKELRVNYEN